MSDHPAPDQGPSQPRQEPTRSRLLGAEIHRVQSVGKPPSAVTGRTGPTGSDTPALGQPGSQAGSTSDDAAESIPAETTTTGSSADLGKLPAPGQSTVDVDPNPDEVDPGSVYAQVGGHETFRKLIDVFYDQVEADPEFRALYPEEDLGPARERLLMFFEQYWGGPRTYQLQRGHPRLRMRHNPFRIDPAARDTWLRYMRVALDAVELPQLYDEMIWDYCQRAAHSMVNSS